MTRLTARQIIDTVVDRDSWQSWDEVLPDVAGDAAYADELTCARAKTGLDESVLTGSASICGHRAGILVCDFGFLGGSIGVAAGHRLTAAIRRATAERLPLLALPTSGGTRMQEGTTAFLQMVRISTAVVDHKAARLPYLVYLRHPTTGGVFASWGSLGHVTVAEPGALIGFLGPRVYEALYRSPFPDGVQTAETFTAVGLSMRCAGRRSSPTSWPGHWTSCQCRGARPSSRPSRTMRPIQCPPGCPCWRPVIPNGRVCVT